MDQSLLAGVGNIYRAETLFRCNIDPFMPCNELSKPRAAALWDDIVSIMNDGVREGKIITTRIDDRHAPGPLWPDNAYYTYQRQHRQCRVCDSGIALMEVAARKLYWCPGCQPKARKRAKR